MRFVNQSRMEKYLPWLTLLKDMKLLFHIFLEDKPLQIFIFYVSFPCFISIFYHLISYPKPFCFSKIQTHQMPTLTNWLTHEKIWAMSFMNLKLVKISRRGRNTILQTLAYTNRKNRLVTLLIPSRLRITTQYNISRYYKSQLWHIPKQTLNSKPATTFAILWDPKGRKLSMAIDWKHWCKCVKSFQKIMLQVQELFFHPLCRYVA